MNLPELPKPDFTHGGRDWPVSGGWEESTVQAYGEACYRAAIEDAAKVCDRLASDVSNYNFVEINNRQLCANEIKELLK